MQEVINNPWWKTVLTGVWRVIIAGLLATSNLQSQHNGQTIEGSSATLESIDRKITAIDKRTLANEQWIYDFVRQHPEKENAPLPGGP